MKSMGVTVYITVVGTLINIFMTCLMAYPLARKDLDYRRPIQMAVIFTMLFSGGMIPTFLIVKELGMIDTYWSLLIPGAISAFNLIILRNFFQQMPEGLEESAKIDGQQLTRAFCSASSCRSRRWLSRPSRCSTR